MHSRTSQFSGKRKIKIAYFASCRAKKLLFEYHAFQVVVLMLGRHNHIHQASLYFGILLLKLPFLLRIKFIYPFGMLNSFMSINFFSLSKQVLCEVFLFLFFPAKFFNQLLFRNCLFLAALQMIDLTNLSTQNNTRQDLVCLSFASGIKILYSVFRYLWRKEIMGWD